MTSPPVNLTLDSLCQLANIPHVPEGSANTEGLSKTHFEELIEITSKASSISAPDLRSNCADMGKRGDVSESTSSPGESEGSDIRRIQQALSPTVVVAFAPISEGLSEDRKYRVRTEGDAEYFVKIFEVAADGSIASQSRNEIEWNVWAADRGIGPGVAYSSIPQGILITRYLTNEMACDKDGKLEPRLSASFATIRALHYSEVPEHAVRYPIPDVTGKWKEAYARLSLSQQQLPFVRFGTEIAEASIARLSSIPYKVVPIHGDFHPWNVMFTRGIAWLIDWTWSGRGDAMQDLAYYAYQAEFAGLTQFEGMLETYNSALSPAERERAKCHFALTHMRFYAEVLLTTSPDKAEWRRKRLRSLEADLIEDGQLLGVDCTRSGFADAAMPPESADLPTRTRHSAEREARRFMSIEADLVDETLWLGLEAVSVGGLRFPNRRPTVLYLNSPR